MSELKERLDRLAREIAEIQQEMAELDEERREALIEVGRQTIEKARRKAITSSPEQADQTAATMGDLLKTISEGAIKIRKLAIENNTKLGI